MTTAASECAREDCGHPADEHIAPGGCYHIMGEGMPFFDCQCEAFMEGGS